MRLTFRALATFIVVITVLFFVFWVPFSLIQVPDGLRTILSLLCAIGAGWYTWRSLGRAASGAMSSILLGAVLVGTVGFCGGFFGPMIVAPDANQGPLLGLLITGPLGFLLGGVGGLVYWYARGSRRALDDAAPLDRQ